MDILIVVNSNSRTIQEKDRLHFKKRLKHKYFKSLSELVLIIKTENKINFRTKMKLVSI